MVNTKGWIKLHRSILDNEFYNIKPFSKGQAWIDLLLLAEHETHEKIWRGQKVTYKRGDVCKSIKQLSIRWGWSHGKVERFLNNLTNMEMINQNVNRNRTTITIVKYGFFQNDQESKRESEWESKRESEWESKRESDRQYYKNIRNKEDKNKYSVCFSTFWNAYPRKKEKANAYKAYNARINAGYTEDELFEACINYADECKRLNREERYIKLGATFLSANEPFVDYLNQNYKPPAPDQRGQKNKFNDFEQRKYDFAELEKVTYGE